jgi:Fe-S-cluster containining protein
MKSDAIQDYRRLRRLVDGECTKLELLHGRHLVCREGCCSCCTDLTVFPVEFYSILAELREAGIKPVFDEGKSCGFLDKDDKCQVYPYRPIICRTHGLPVAFLNHDMDPPEMSVTFCEKNFTNTDPMDYIFGPKNTLNLEILNERLARINAAFMENCDDQSITPHDRIPLRELVNHL